VWPPIIEFAHEGIEAIEQSVGAREGNAVVGADGGGQAALDEEVFERGDGGVFAGGAERSAEQHGAAKLAR
jgi:hypothetical protein